MITSERYRKALLAAKEYPVKIKTKDGKYLIRVITFTKDEYGMPVNHRETFAQFSTLAEAVECGIRWKEARYL